MRAELRSSKINGVHEVVSHPFVDSRGSFLNVFRAQEDSYLRSWGGMGISQVNLSRNEALGTIRGVHLQASPHSEVKLVRCLRGRVWDVAVDLRQDSDTWCQWYAVELSPRQANALLIPAGCGHGFQVLEPGSELLYLHSGTWVQEAEIGVRWDDPSLAITWPLPVTDLSDRDRHLPFLSDILSTNQSFQ